MKRLCILGSTGSIGCSSLEVVRLHPELYQVYALSAHTQVDKLVAQCIEFQPDYAVIADPKLHSQLTQALVAAKLNTKALAGAEALAQVASATAVDAVIAAVVGAAGLASTYCAVQAGKQILLANKEALVMAGQLMLDAAAISGATLLPIDSEHNAIFQCLAEFYQQERRPEEITSLLLTASGGPFATTAIAELDAITPEQALKHPNWNMGPKISVDSATMMNKALEVIEAHYLFQIPAEKIKVVLHPQSIVHSGVNYCDGSTLVQMGPNDMRVPIAVALAWPKRIQSGLKNLDFSQTMALNFAPVDQQRFPCLGLAYDCLVAGGAATVVLNAANEVAVAAFMQRQLRFTDIYRVCAQLLSDFQAAAPTDITELAAIDAEARVLATALINSYSAS